ncbi:MAG: Response regulator PleD [Deltaproteobacteria bacterium ADurb.BinA179]|jgi:diguanylate cyclase (GGDEF)-like protein|nr:diguanylate cyclase [Deltaproteobacteria bacterium]MDI9542283.1 diguanylate cyclase [Pseudomonadota bacterium]OPZ29093.1 MAG: Response regulator PleD [Deltaproteobacteria bacterium ADurb.BinA179]HRR21340.1 diguanylate cyclase [Desulfomonilia bacterium]HNR49964.1 diguanylate cyclase [Deltaproteobacteria bacterium]
MKFYTDSDIRGLLSRVRENEETARKFFEVETSVLSTLDFADFFDKLLSTIMSKFNVGHVWVTLIDTGKATRLIQTYASFAVPERHLKIIDRQTFSLLVPDTGTPMLRNDGLDPFAPLIPAGLKREFNSIAVIPLSLDGEVAGSLNFADLSVERFSPDADPSLLEQLGLVVSICLSNVAAHEEIKTLAFRDPLTGLLNRRAMERALNREIARAKRYRGDLSVVFIDLDDFKKVNDSLGHDRGDEYLVYIASTMSKMARQSDVVSRFAGDEFVLILPETSTAEAEYLILRMQRYFNDHPASLGGARVPVRFSYGIASPDTAGEWSAAALLKQADELLYRNKRDRKAGR